jgi:hypothetical protein
LNTAPNPVGHLDIGGVFSRTGDIYKVSFGTIWLVALAIAIPVAIIRGLLEVPDSWFFSLIGLIVGVLGSVWISGSLVKVVQDVESDGTLDAGVGEILKVVTPLLVPLFFLFVVVTFLVYVGLLFLVAPGIFLALIWSVSVPAMVVEGQGVFGAMGRSKDLTKGNRWRILGVAVVVFIAYLVVALIIILLNLITPILAIIGGIAAIVIIYPYVAIIIGVLYFRLVESQGGAAVAGGGLTEGIEQVEEVEVVEEVDQDIQDPGSPEDRL